MPLLDSFPNDLHPNILTHKDKFTSSVHFQRLVENCSSSVVASLEKGFSAQAVQKIDNIYLQKSSVSLSV